MLFSFTNIQAQDNWQVQNTPVNKTLRNCFFIDSLNGWASGDSGVIIHTTNGGNNWAAQNSGIGFPIDDIYFLNQNTGWAIGNEFFFEGTTILKTTNGGNNWSLTAFPDTVAVLNTIIFNDTLNGWVCGYGGAFYKTSNGGSTWSKCPVDSSFGGGFPVRSLAIYDSSLAYGGGGQMDIAGVMWRTTNGGTSWQSTVVAAEPIYDIYMFDSLNAIGTGGDFEYGVHIVTTSNAGANWEYQSLQIFGQGEAISFRTLNEAWIPLAFSQTWAFTANGGRDWTSFPTPDSRALYDVVFLDSLHGWCVGDSGIVAKYIPSTVGINNGNETILPSSMLYQNYPNPFNPQTTISFYLNKPERVSIKIFNSLGREVKNLNIGLRSSGEHNISFDGTELPSGVYYYKLEAGKFSETKKMAIIK